MSSITEIKSLAMNLPKRSRLKLAVDLLSSASPSVSKDELLAEAARRDVQIESGDVKLLDEKTFWTGVRPRSGKA